MLREFELATVAGFGKFVRRSCIFYPWFKHRYWDSTTETLLSSLLVQKMEEETILNTSYLKALIYLNRRPWAKAMQRSFGNLFLHCR